VIGQGTWHMGDDRRLKKDEIIARRLGIELGLIHIDTAEMCGDGQAEEIVTDPVAGRCDRDIEKDVVPLCERERIAVVGCTTLARGGFRRSSIDPEHRR
jgi:aryl-alcohol dehydrogenase-like predicted oxidoreductase